MIPSYNPGISDVSYVQFISGGALYAKAALYGIGIGNDIALIKFDESPSEDFQVPDTKDTPDAFKNSSGGYTKTDRWDGYMSQSLIGMPVMCYLQFVGGTYTDLQGNQVSFNDVTLESVLLNVTMNNVIEKTEIWGRSQGDVKEYIGMGDWDVEIRAIITADAPVNSTITKKDSFGIYPRENMAELFKILKAPISIPVICWYLNQFDIRYLTVRPGVQIQQIEGEYDMQRVIIPCWSDTPLVIKIDGNA